MRADVWRQKVAEVVRDGFRAEHRGGTHVLRTPKITAARSRPERKDRCGALLPKRPDLDYQGVGFPP